MVATSFKADPAELAPLRILVPPFVCVSFVPFFSFVLGASDLESSWFALDFAGGIALGEKESGGRKLIRRSVVPMQRRKELRFLFSVGNTTPSTSKIESSSTPRSQRKGQMDH